MKKNIIYIIYGVFIALYAAITVSEIWDDFAGLSRGRHFSGTTLFDLSRDFGLIALLIASPVFSIFSVFILLMQLDSKAVQKTIGVFLKTVAILLMLTSHFVIFVVQFRPIGMIFFYAPNFIIAPLSVLGAIVLAITIAVIIRSLNIARENQKWQLRTKTLVIVPIAILSIGFSSLFLGEFLRPRIIVKSAVIVQNSIEGVDPRSQTLRQWEVESILSALDRWFPDFRNSPSFAAVAEQFSSCDEDRDQPSVDKKSSAACFVGVSVTAGIMATSFLFTSYALATLSVA